MRPVFLNDCDLFGDLCSPENSASCYKIHLRSYLLHSGTMLIECMHVAVYDYRIAAQRLSLAGNSARIVCDHLVLRFQGKMQLSEELLKGKMIFFY